MSGTMPDETWVRRARYSSNHDGDTVTLDIDLGFGVHFGAPATLRILGVNAPELATPAGPPARDFVAAWFAAKGAESWPFRVRTVKNAPDKFGGRYDAEIWRVRDGASLSADLIAAGQAVAWSGHGPKPVAGVQP